MDFRDTPPVWVRYAEWVGNGHDKYYELRVDMADDGLFYLTARWGRRPDTGAGQTKVYDKVKNAQVATQQADAIFDGKLHKGYRKVDRPLAADSKVAKDYTSEDEDY